uniref:Uncharacterized protein n=1 Tax=Ceratitis capitata TaxID=7213 RepID=W8B9C6_CERCA
MCLKHCMILIDFVEVDEMPQCEIAMILRTPPITCGCDLLRKMVVLNLRRCSGRNNSLAPFVEPGGSRRVGPRKELELCKRVLTTSKGQVTTAPTVPAVPPATKCMSVSR